MYIAQSKSLSVADQFARLRAAEVALRNAAAQNNWILPTAERSGHRQRIEDLSGGRNTVLYTPDGVPGVYVRVYNDDLALTDVATEIGLADRQHDAFRVDGEWKNHYYVGKYLATCADVSTGALFSAISGAATNIRVLSLPGLDPSNNMTFDEAASYATQDGADGCHLMTNAEWAYIYLLTLCWGYEPRGNTSSGRDYARTDEYGSLLRSGDSRTLTGSGPVSWSHDGTPYGIADMCGNIWEWSLGLRYVDGEIQIIPDNDAVFADTSAGSNDWRAIDAATGDLVAPGTNGSLKWDVITSSPVLSDIVTGNGSVSAQWSTLTANVTVPATAKRLALYPLDALRPVRGRQWINNEGERLPRRGGSRAGSSIAGVAALNGNGTRGIRNALTGFRSAFAL